MALGESIKKAIPWIEPILDYFDWRKRIIALVIAGAIAGWSFMKGLPWPVIVTVAFSMLVMVAYALVFPAIVKIAHVGYHPRPNVEIWKHKKHFLLYEAACLLADTVPERVEDRMSADARAWLVVLADAVSAGEMKSNYEDGNQRPMMYTRVPRSELQAFCKAHHRSPEFLSD